MQYVTTGIGIPASSDERVTKWFKRLRDAIAVRSVEAEDWQKNEDQVFSRHPESTGDTMDITDVNKTASWLEARCAALAFRRPRVKITPQTAEGWLGERVPVIDKQSGQVVGERTIARHKVLETVVNNIISKPSFGLPATIRRIIRGGYISSVGGGKVGYTADFEDIGEDEIPYMPAEYAAYMSREELTDKYEFDGDSPMVNEDGMLVPKGLLPIAEQWFIEYASYKRLLFDPDGENDFRDHKWVAYEYRMTLSDVKKDKRFKNTEGITAGTINRRDEKETDWTAPIENRGPGKVTDDSKFVTLYDCWDFEEGKWITIADNHDKFLAERDFPKGVDQTTGPWSFYRPNERETEWYGTPDANDLRRMDKWLTVANQQVLRDMRKSAQKILYRSGILNTTEAQKLVDPQDRAIAVDLPNEIPLEAVAMLMSVGGVNAGTLAMKNDIMGDFNERAGQPPAARGSAEADTAAEVKALTAYDHLREDYHRGMLKECLVDLLEKLTISIQENMTKDQYMDLVGDDGEVFAARVSRNMLQCAVNVDIDIADMTPMDDNAMGANAIRALTLYQQQPLMGVDEDMNSAMLDLLGIKDERIARGLTKIAKLQVQMMMVEKQPGKPQTGPSRDDSHAAAQQGGQ